MNDKKSNPFASDDLYKYYEMACFSGSCSYENSPDKYLYFSKEDLLEEGFSTRCLVNSISNSKRALHLQVEIICKHFGIDRLYNKSLNFPTRLEFLKKCGVINSRILLKINKSRNKIEHDYYLPNKEEAENYFDITELFINSTNKYVNQFPEKLEFELYEEKNKCCSLPEYLNIIIEKEKGQIEINTGNTVILDTSIESEEYFQWLSTIMYIHDMRG
jgi:hypothetical protein